MGQSASYSLQQQEGEYPSPTTPRRLGTTTDDTPTAVVGGRDHTIDLGSPVNSDEEVDDNPSLGLGDDDPESETMVFDEEESSNVSSLRDLGYHDHAAAEQQEEGFVPWVDHEWMHRSIESLVLGYRSRAPLLTVTPVAHHGSHQQHDDFDAVFRRRSTGSTFGGRRCSISATPGRGGTLAILQRRDNVDRSSLSSRRGSITNAPRHRRLSIVNTTNKTNTGESRRSEGPNIVLNIVAREMTGKPSYRRTPSRAHHFHCAGGAPLFSRLDRPAAGIASEVLFLTTAITAGDWTETHLIVSRLVTRLVTTNTSNPTDPQSSSSRHHHQDPNVPAQAPKFYAGGGRVGLERDTFCVAGGVRALLRIFRETSIVGSLVATSRDARDLSPGTVAMRLAPCWNETLLILRELLYFTPQLIRHDACWCEELLPFLFTLMSHDSCFEGAAAMIEELLSAMAQQPETATTFCLAGIPKLFELWRGFSPQQLSHFCRILALLIFEPEDRALLETSTVIKSLELLRLRRSRSARRDPTVDINQSLLLSDDVLLKRLIKLLRLMNHAPPLRRFTPYHVLSRFPFVAETLVMLGLTELTDWNEFERQDALAAGSQGTVVEMLEALHESLNQPNTQITHILHVISAAQQAGVVVGRQRRQRVEAYDSTSEESAVATFAGLLTDQVLVRRLYQSSNERAGLGLAASSSPDALDLGIVSAKDAANSLQFNAMLLGPFQVECLFVLCTLLGGRRKMDAQDIFLDLGLVEVLETMFERLPFASESVANEHRAPGQPNGIHGPNCDCTPESALCIQFLRLLHNFCDRDCDNYEGRQLMLSRSERLFVFGDGTLKKTTPGLMSKLVQAFIRETDESPYRFWLSSCIESFLRGSSHAEQAFVGRSGLLDNLIEAVCSDRLHCSGSLQTSFDILGEIGKGNPNVLHEMVSKLDEERFCKLMRVASTNLVDSNVFIRSLLLGLERQRLRNIALTVQGPAVSYLSHSWFDVPSSVLDDACQVNENAVSSPPLDWFPSVYAANESFECELEEPFVSSCTFDWVFAPPMAEDGTRPYPPDTLDRLSSVLSCNRARLLRDLLTVIDIENVNHENICCANTAVVLAILAHRRNQLATLLGELRRISQEERESRRHARSIINETEICTPVGHETSKYRSVRDADFDVLTNFREILWFWLEYYTRRGRDRLSLEFSSHIRFQEWETVVRLLAADDGSATSLIDSPIRLPRSPYRCSAAAVRDAIRRRA